MRSISHAPDVGSHAAADIQQQDDVNRHLLALEIPDFLRLTIHSQDEILDSEAENGMVSSVHYLGIDTTQGDIAAKSNGRIIGLRGSDSPGGGNQQAYCSDRQKDVHALHERPPYELALQMVVRQELFRLRCGGGERGAKSLGVAALECNQYYAAWPGQSSKRSWKV
jgi:hypothetical protein